MEEKTYTLKQIIELVLSIYDEPHLEWCFVDEHGKEIMGTDVGYALTGIDYLLYRLENYPNMSDGSKNEVPRAWEKYAK